MSILAYPNVEKRTHKREVFLPDDWPRIMAPLELHQIATPIAENPLTIKFFRGRFDIYNN